MSSSEERLPANADLNPGKATVMAYLLYSSLAGEQGTCQTPQETPLLMNVPLTSHPGVRPGLEAVGLVPSTQPWVWSRHPGVLNGAISQLRYKWHPQTGPSPSDPPRQLPQPIHALCSTPNLRTLPWHSSGQAALDPRTGRAPLPPRCAGTLFLVLDTDQLCMIQGTGRHPKA